MLTYSFFIYWFLGVQYCRPDLDADMPIGKLSLLLCKFLYMLYSSCSVKRLGKDKTPLLLESLNEPLMVVAPICETCVVIAMCAFTSCVS